MPHLYRFFLIAALLLSIPTYSFAATTTSIVPISAVADHFYMSVPFTLPISQHIDQNHGNLRVTFANFIHLKSFVGVPSTSPYRQDGATLLLNYSGCTTGYCSTPAYPTMTTNLWPGQSTYYLNYKITLDSFSDKSAIITATIK